MKKKRLIKAIEENTVLKNRVSELEENVSYLQASVCNLQNLARILERDICAVRDITAIGEGVKDSVLKGKH